MGAILNVSHLCPAGRRRVKVIVAVQTRSAVREIEIAGAQRIKPRRIRKEIGIRIKLDGERGGVGEKAARKLSIFIKHVVQRRRCAISGRAH